MEIRKVVVPSPWEQKSTSERGCCKTVYGCLIQAGLIGLNGSSEDASAKNKVKGRPLQDALKSF
jgi:hypothetical protein